MKALLKEDFANLSTPEKVEKPISGWMIRGLGAPSMVHPEQVGHHTSENMTIRVKSKA